MRKSRRDFLKASAGAVAAGTFPAIVPSTVFGKSAPSNRINVAAIGTGRISRIHDIPEVLKYPTTRIMAVCDVDAKRAAEARQLVNELYTEQQGKPWDGVDVYTDYRELLQDEEIDAAVLEQ